MGGETVPHFSQVLAWPADPACTPPADGAEARPPLPRHESGCRQRDLVLAEAKNGPCTRVSLKRASSVSRVASTAKSGAPSRVPRNVAVATSPKRSASARDSRSSLPSASKSALPPSQTT